MIRVYSMAISRADFMRTLARLAPDALVSSDGSMVEVRYQQTNVNIALNEKPAWTLASLKLSRLDVEIECVECSAAQQQAFIAAFEQAFQRGGG